VNKQPVYLRQAVDHLLAALGENLMGVVLYGSRARGEAREESDVDLLVIARGLPEGWYKRRVFVHRPLKAINDAPPILVFAQTPEEFEQHFPSIYLDIGQDGIILYDPQGYIAHRLQRIREITLQAGLVRKRTNGEMNWVWLTPPKRHWEITWDGFRELVR
jgi:predicted nucleotidyltransferase